MANIIEHEGKKYVRIGDKVILIDHFDDNGDPVIGCWSEEKPNAQGGMDCTVHVGCFQIAAVENKPT